MGAIIIKIGLSPLSEERTAAKKIYCALVCLCDQFPQEQVYNLKRSMPIRVQTVTQESGGNTQYSKLTFHNFIFLF